MVARFAQLSEQEAALLRDRAAPIVVLTAAGEPLAAGIAPGQHVITSYSIHYTKLYDGLRGHHQRAQRGRGVPVHHQVV